MHIAFLLHNAFGIGGTIRAVTNLSQALAERHHVEIVSVFRSADTPTLSVDPRVQTTSLVDTRHEPDNTGPSRIYPAAEARYDLYSRLTDHRITKYLRSTSADVVIGTRPGLNVCLADLGSRRYLRIGQEHVTYDLHSPDLRTAQNQAIAQLDAFVTVSEADAAGYRTALPALADRIRAIPNGVPPTRLSPADGHSKLVVAAGRLIPVKHYELLVDAFAKVVTERPDWRLRLYGRGPRRQELRDQIDELGLHEHVRLMGPVSPIETEWAKGAIAAVTSSVESFGLTIVEAMRAGIPVVSTDCPHGPREIITHGRDGFLVPNGDAHAIADALLHLINDDALRLAMGRAAVHTARTFEPQHAAARYERLFADLGGVTRRRFLRRKPVLPTPPPQRPAADCVVDTDGDLHIHLPANTLATAVVCRLRTDPTKTLRLPYPSPAISRRRHALSDGRWDLYLESPDGTLTRLAAGLCDTRALMAGRGGITVRIPYTTDKGNLSIRVWQRPTHAEVDRIEVDTTCTVVDGRILGAAFTGTAVAESRAGQQSVEVRLAQRGDLFRLVVDHACLTAAGEDTWDLWLRPANGDPIRVGRLLDDIVNRSEIDVYRTAELHGLRIRPYYTTANNLSIRVRPA